MNITHSIDILYKKIKLKELKKKKSGTKILEKRRKLKKNDKKNDLFPNNFLIYGKNTDDSESFFDSEMNLDGLYLFGYRESNFVTFLNDELRKILDEFDEMTKKKICSYENFFGGIGEEMNLQEKKSEVNNIENLLDYTLSILHDDEKVFAENIDEEKYEYQKENTYQWRIEDYEPKNFEKSRKYDNRKKLILEKKRKLSQIEEKTFKIKELPFFFQKIRKIIVRDEKIQNNQPEEQKHIYSIESITKFPPNNLHDGGENNCFSCGEKIIENFSFVDKAKIFEIFFEKEEKDEEFNLFFSSFYNIEKKEKLFDYFMKKIGMKRYISIDKFFDQIEDFGNPGTSRNNEKPTSGMTNIFFCYQCTIKRIFSCDVDLCVGEIQKNSKCSKHLHHINSKKKCTFKKKLENIIKSKKKGKKKSSNKKTNEKRCNKIIFANSLCETHFQTLITREIN